MKIADWVCAAMCAAWALALLWASVPDNDLLKALWTQNFTAWLAIGVNVGGLYFIFRQLKAAEAAVRASSESTQAASAAAAAALQDTRAWVALDDVVLERGQRDEDGRLNVTLSVRCENLGRTPAHHVTLRASAVPHLADLVEFQASLFDEFAAGLTLFPGRQETGHIVCPLHFDHDSNVGMAIVTARYRTTAGDIAYTPRLFVATVGPGPLRFVPATSNLMTAT